MSVTDSRRRVYGAPPGYRSTWSHANQDGVLFGRVADKFSEEWLFWMEQPRIFLSVNPLGPRGENLSLARMAATIMLAIDKLRAAGRPVPW